MAKSKQTKPKQKQNKSQRMQSILFASIAAIIILSMVLSAVRF